jgi:hypothetical protein
MKKINILGIFALTAILLVSCSNFLDEQPRSSLTPDYFTSDAGIEAGLTAAYSGLRYQYGPEGAMVITVVGTDEFTYGGDGAAIEINNYGSALFNNGHLQTPWNRNFTYINTCNGIIEFGAEGGNPQLIAEAKFLRAQYYYNLVTTFGGVPLDLGSGELKFNTTPSTTSARNTEEEVYAAMLQDFKDAFEDLPNSPARTGAVTKSAALHYIAKTYLAVEDYQNALTYAKMLIDDAEGARTYGAYLLDDFRDVNRDGNEHNPEVLFVVEHTGASYEFDESGEGAMGGPESGLKENRANFMMCPYYENQGLINGNKPLTRTIEYGRGWRRFMPTPWLLNVAFAEKLHDSRYDASFQKVWYATVEVEGDNGQTLHVGDTAFYMPGYEMSPSEKAAFVERTGARVYLPSDYEPDADGGTKKRQMFPANLKLAAPSRNGVNDASNRPFLIAKLSETYLIAAEAALMAGQDPTPYINKLRHRAAYRNPDDYRGFEDSQDGAANLVNMGYDYQTALEAMTVTRDQIDLDFILNEKSRELCGEQHRFFDLARTGKLVERVQLFNPEQPAKENVRDYHRLRPIPQSQIDLMTNEDKANYQNPGYNQ